MPNLKKGLSELVRAETGLGAKQLRRSTTQYQAQRAKVALKIRETFLPKTVEKPEPEATSKTEPEATSEKPTS